MVWAAEYTYHMTANRFFQILPALLALVAGAALYFVTASIRLPVDALTAIGAENIQAHVTEIIEDGQIDLGGRNQRYQVARVLVAEGKYAGITMEMDYGKRQVLPAGSVYLTPGDPVLVTISAGPDGVLNVYFADFVRTRPLLWLTGLFALAIVLISGWKGFRSLLSLAFSLYVITSYVVPMILTGQDPVSVSITGSIILLGVTLYLTYGWTLKTHAAVASMILVLLLTGLLAVLFVDLTRLRGIGDESALFLLQSMNLQINLRGLLLGGLLIGALGVLDDLVTTQASAVFELHHANPGWGFADLFRSAIRIGQDHVAATVNTLVLAYAGASLPLFLLFTLGRGSYGTLVNFEFVAEEIVRTLVGSLGLIAAVPLTTTIAIFFALRVESLGWVRQVLGPVGGGDGHSHSH